MRGGAARRPVPSWWPAAPGGAVGGGPGSRAAAPEGGSAGSTFTTNVALLSILLWRTCCRRPPRRLTRCAMEDSPWDSHQASRRHLLSCTAVDSVAGSWSELTADVLPSFQCGRAAKGSPSKGGLRVSNAPSQEVPERRRRLPAFGGGGAAKSAKGYAGGARGAQPTPCPSCHRWLLTPSVTCRHEEVGGRPRWQPGRTPKNPHPLQDRLP